MNNDIMQAFFQQLSAANLGYPIAWPNANFTPPNTGEWLEVIHQPNRGIDQSIASQSVVRQGLFTVIINGRQNMGVFKLGEIAEQIKAAFPKLTSLATARVVRAPYPATPSRIGSKGGYDIDGGIIGLPVTIEYSE